MADPQQPQRMEELFISDNIDSNPSTRWSFSYEYEGYDDGPNHAWWCPLECMQCRGQVRGADNQMRSCKRKTCYTLPYCWQHLKSQGKLKIGRTRLISAETHQRYTFKGLFACRSKKLANDNDTTPVFEKGQVIVPYVSDIINDEELNLRYPGEDETAPYILNMFDNGAADAHGHGGSSTGKQAHHYNADSGRSMSSIRNRKKAGKRATRFHKGELPKRHHLRRQKTTGNEPWYGDSACVRGVAALANDKLSEDTCDADSRRSGLRRQNCIINADFVVDKSGQKHPNLRAIADIFDGDEIYVSYGKNYWDGNHGTHQTKPKSVYNRIEYKC